MAIQEEKVKETLRSLHGQRERLKQELWATEGAIAVCVALLEGKEEGEDLTTEVTEIREEILTTEDTKKEKRKRDAI